MIEIMVSSPSVANEDIIPKEIASELNFDWITGTR